MYGYKIHLFCPNPNTGQVFQISYIAITIMKNLTHTDLRPHGKCTCTTNSYQWNSKAQQYRRLETSKYRDA